MNAEIVLKTFLQEKEVEGLSSSSIKNYENCCRDFIERVGMTDTSQINKGLVNSYILTVKNRNLSIASINHYIVQVRAFIYWLAKEGYCEPIKIKTVKGQEEKPKFYTDEELERLLKKPDSKASFAEWRTYTMICFILATGARISTVVNVRMEDIDFAAKEIVYTHLKNKSVVNIPISNSLLKTLKEFLKLWTIETYLFPDVGGEQLTTNAARLALERYCKHKKVKCKGLHSLRHTYARLYIKNGGNAFMLQRMLCHRDLTMTRKYVALFSQDLHQNYEAYSPLDNLKKVGNHAQLVQRKR